MYWVVTGAGGNVGSHVVAALEAAPNEVCEHVVAVCRQRIPLLSRAGSQQQRVCVVKTDGSIESTLKALDDHEMLLCAQRVSVVHTAAVTSIAHAYDSPDECERVNVALTRALAEWCERRGAVFVYCSTDMVFNGDLPTSEIEGSKQRFDEACVAQPLSQYGRSKLAGEAAAMSAAPTKAVVVRLPLMYGAPHRADGWASPFANTVRSVRRSFDASTEGDSPLRIEGFADEIRTPLSYSAAAHILISVALNAHGGVASHNRLFLASCSERSSRLQLVEAIARAALPEGAELASIHVVLVPTSQADYNKSSTEPRPRDLSMSNARLTAMCDAFLAHHSAVSAVWRPDSSLWCGALSTQVRLAVAHLDALPK